MTAALERKPSHCQRVLAVLMDGEPHSHLELYALGVVLHSRVAELRDRGFVIPEPEIEVGADDSRDRVYWYRLVRGPEGTGPDEWPELCRRPRRRRTGVPTHDGAEEATAETMAAAATGTMEAPAETAAVGASARASLVELAPPVQLQLSLGEAA